MNMRFDVKKILKTVGLVLVITVVATILDWIAHGTSPAFYVPYEYYRNKVIFATLWGLAALLIFKKVRDTNVKALLFSLVIAVALQAKYFLLGYDLFFVFLFMGLHFGMFLLPALVIFKKYEDIFG